MCNQEILREYFQKNENFHLSIFNEDEIVGDIDINNIHVSGPTFSDGQNISIHNIQESNITLNNDFEFLEEGQEYHLKYMNENNNIIKEIGKFYFENNSFNKID